jgi:CMP-N-acetylneuraminic acid synthetase
VGGKRLIQWTLEAAHDAAKIDKVYVSTENADIKDFVKSFGVEVLDRLPELAFPEVQASLVVRYVLRHQVQSDAFCLLQPTSPLRTSQDIDDAITLFKESDANAVFSVTQDCKYGFEMVQVDDFIKPAILERVREGSQYWPPRWILNGCIYVAKTKPFLEAGVEMKGVLPFRMPQSRSLDIDTPFDLRLADLLQAPLLQASLLQASGMSEIGWSGCRFIL